MKYVESTCKYLFTHILRLGVIALPAAIITAIFLLPDGFDVIISKTALEGVVTFGDIFFLVFGKNILKRWYMLIIGFFLIVVTVSYTMGIIEKHLKVGKLSMRRPFAAVNNCFWPVFKAFGLIFIIYVAYKFLFVCVARLLVAIFAFAPASVMAVVIVLLNAVAFLAVLLIVRPFGFTAAIMLVYGYSFKDAFGVAMTLGEESGKHRLRLAIVLPFALYVAISVLIGALPIHYIIQVIIHIVMVAILMQYVVVYVMLAVFDLAGLERRDNKRYY